MAPRVTNAELATMLESLDEKVGDISAEIKAMNGRQREDHDQITKLKERQSVLAGATTIFGVIGNIVAAATGIYINR